MSIRRNIKRIIVPLSVSIDRVLVRLHMVKPRVIMYMDGGICSQMTMWINGQYYAEQGLDVYYDLDWYRRDGKGIDKTSERKYELELLWPYIKVRTLPRIVTLFYRRFLPWLEYSDVLPNLTDISGRSVYLGGYRRLPNDEKIRLYRKNFSLRTAAKTEKIYLDNSLKYCGVHVRRGDLTNINLPDYPQVAEGYFLRAIKYVQQHECVDEFLLFSEDPQWLRDNILPNVSVKCRIMEGNTAIEDLILLAQCQIIIASQGSFGPTAALLNPCCKLLVRNVQVSCPPFAQREVQIQ